MKSRFLYILWIISVPVVAQVPGTNYNSASKSTAMGADMVVLTQVIEPEIRRSINGFNKYYDNRLLYYAETLIDAGSVLNEIDNVRQRIFLLNVENSSLSFFYPFKKQDNKRKIDAILYAVNGLRSRLLGLPWSVNTIYGERMNLNQDTEIALESLERQLDAIESDIDKSKLIRQLFPL
ncbi:MAG: hypothetical protein AAGB24_13975 [Bacteroidota bacterium]